MSKEPLPQFRSYLKLAGKHYGDITIEPDGTFHGKIDREIQALLIELAKVGMSDGLILTFSPVPAVPEERPSGPWANPTA